MIEGWTSELTVFKRMNLRLSYFDDSNNVNWKKLQKLSNFKSLDFTLRVKILVSKLWFTKKSSSITYHKTLPCQKQRSHLVFLYCRWNIQTISFQLYLSAELSLPGACLWNFWLELIKINICECILINRIAE